MTDTPVELKVGGQTYRVVTSANQEELRELASMVEQALYEVTAPGRQPSQNALVLAAVTLAHELKEERAQRAALELRHKNMLGRVLAKIDEVLGEEPPLEATPFGASVDRQPEEVPAFAHRRALLAHGSAKRGD